MVWQFQQLMAAVALHDISHLLHAIYRTMWRIQWYIRKTRLACKVLIIKWFFGYINSCTYAVVFYLSVRVHMRNTVRAVGGARVTCIHKYRISCNRSPWLALERCRRSGHVLELIRCPVLSVSAVSTQLQRRQDSFVLSRPCFQFPSLQ